MKISTIERFERHYIPEPNSGCWLWLAAVDTQGMGYGFFHMKNTTKAHIAAYKLFRGPTNGFHVCHHCDVPICVNPDHLFLGTAKDNIDDCMRKGRRMYVYGEAHGRSILTRTDVLAIRSDQRATRFIAADYKINKATVRKIRRRALWGHIA